jgi:hypothetical protein
LPEVVLQINNSPPTANNFNAVVFGAYAFGAIPNGIFSIEKFNHKGTFSFTMMFAFEKILAMQTTVSTVEKAVAEGLRDQLPLKGLAGVSIRNVRERSDQPFDISFDLISGKNRIQVLGEIKAAFTPRSLEQIAPWIRRLRSLRTDVSVAVIAPVLSSQAQAFCIQNGVDFLDLAGNVFINVPGKFTLQRSGIRARTESVATSQSARNVNVYSGRYSRVLRVLLENPTSWTVTGIVRELEAESNRFKGRFPGPPVDFKISTGSVSKAVASLEEQIGVRRRGTAVVVPEPLRLLQQWAEKYKERYRWRLRSSFMTANPFGRDLATIAKGIGPIIKGAYAFSGAIAASFSAPFVDIDMADLFILNGEAGTLLREIRPQDDDGPRLRLIIPYDPGVFMYLQKIDTASVVSPIQAYLDLYARGGRDLKQAEYLLDAVIQRKWRTA